jgi:hypothetical protein
MVGPSSRSAADRKPDCLRETGPLQVGRATLPRVRISLLRTRELVRHSLGGVGSASLRKRFREAGLVLHSRARSGSLSKRRRGEGGLVLRSHKLGTAFANKRRGEGGVSLVELSVALFLLTAVAVFGFQTMMSGWMLQNSSIMQSMTDAYAGIETAYAQRWTFANIPASGRWPVYPASTSAAVTIGKTPKGPVNATVVRTSRQYTDPLTLAQSYMLESYIVYKDELRQYCKVSKVYRTE